MRNIKEVKKELSQLREKYEAETARLRIEMDSIRKARGFKPKERSFEPYYEAGRSSMPTPSGGMGGCR